MEAKYLQIYQRAINRIDDYFEYSMESKVDQARVREILKELSDSLAAVNTP